MVLSISYHIANIYRNKLQNILECFVDCAITHKKRFVLYVADLYTVRVKYGIITWGNAAKTYLC